MGLLYGAEVVCAFVAGIVVDAAFGTVSWCPHLEALAAWVRLHTVLRAAATDVGYLASWALEAPIVLTTAGDHSSVMAVVISAFVGSRRLMRRGGP